MLQELTIKNFAIMDDLNISFSDGLTILSGETGAGKSIIINAANLLLGSRASASLIRTGAETAELEALFEIIPESQIAKIIKQHGFNASEGLLIRRIISRGDRHRIYINGRLATIQILNSITENLASISGQHAHQGLLQEEQQLIILDQFGGLMPLRAEVYRVFHEIVPLIEKLQNLKLKKDRQQERIELLQFQKKEIAEAAITPGEDTALEKERMLLKNGEALYQAIHVSVDALYNAPDAIVERLVEVKKNFDKACLIDPELSSKAKDISNAALQIEDIAQELRTYLRNVQIDEKRLEEVEERLDTLQKLKRKYGGSLEAVISHLESIDNELSKIGNISENIEETEARLSELHSKLAGQAMQLSEKRKQTSENLAEKVEKELATLNMPQTKFQVSLKIVPADDKTDPYLATGEKAIHDTGIDIATFLIAPNVGEPLKPLASIVSGGELSRLMLTVKSLVAAKKYLPTIIFDEIDSGVSGEVAGKMGAIIQKMARNMQIIAITHLPQIASRGTHHYLVLKKMVEQSTQTFVKRLTDDERITEVAKMLSDTKVSVSAVATARELLNN